VNFQKILKIYLKKFEYKSISSGDYISTFNEELEKIYSKEESKEIQSKIDWEKWINLPGYPIEKIELSKYINFLFYFIESKWIDTANEFAELFLSEKIDKIKESDIEEFMKWHTNVKIVFLNYLEKNINRINNDTYERLRDTLKLHNGHNVEISFTWYLICIQLCMRDVLPYVKKLLSCNGRMKYIKPLYFNLFNFDRNEAISYFEEYK
jgi:leukotriene-A4 hydrolase